MGFSVGTQVLRLGWFPIKSLLSNVCVDGLLTEEAVSMPAPWVGGARNSVPSPGDQSDQGHTQLIQQL